MRKALIITNLTKKFQAGHYSMIDPLKELGYEVHWAANFSEYKEKLDDVSIKIHQIDFNRNPFRIDNIKAFNQLNKLLQVENYDVIHCNSPVGGLLGRICGKKNNIPKIIYTVHGFHFYKGANFIKNIIYKNIEKFLAMYTDAIITITNEDYENLKKIRLRNNSNNKYLINGIGIDIVNPNTIISKRDELENNYKIKSDDIILVSVGELNKNKNHQLVIKALSKIENKSIQYILCGEGLEKENLRMLAKKYEIEDRVHFLGFRNDITNILKSSDIFVMPSIREGLSRAIMEAMSLGLPLLVSNIRGNVDMVQNEINGYLFDTNNTEELKNSIEKVISEKERNKFRDNNLNKCNMYSLENIKVNMKKIYIEILNKS